MEIEAGLDLSVRQFVSFTLRYISFLMINTVVKRNHETENITYPNLVDWPIKNPSIFKYSRND